MYRKGKILSIRLMKDKKEAIRIIDKYDFVCKYLCILLKI